jgi:pentatricopeptide repeat protein
LQVYAQLENLSSADPPYKSVAALNCVILGCANIWDIERAYETFEAMKDKFGLTPDIHSYNALLHAFGKLKKVLILSILPWCSYDLLKVSVCQLDNYPFNYLLPFCVAQTEEAVNVFQHLTSLDVKPNATTYSLLVDAHLVNRDPKAALAVIDEMVT